MIDVCLALKHGSCLLMVDNKIRCNAQILLETLFPTIPRSSGVTIMQTTPSLFTRWSSNIIRTRVLSKESKLRILTLGGEEFPSVVKAAQWINWNETHAKRIFNVYGLTEMSCWASVHEVTKEDIFRRTRIPIGLPIDDQTHFVIDATGELLIKSSTRKCFHSAITDDQVIDEKFEFILHTGDKANAALNENVFYFYSRMDSIVKYFGQKVNLDLIEKIAKGVEAVDEAVCIFKNEENKIILFVKWKIAGEPNEIRKAITEFGLNITIKIESIKEFPLTDHGKVDRFLLLEKIHSTKIDKTLPLTLTFLEIVNEIVGTNLKPPSPEEDSAKKAKTEWYSSFFSIGGTSLKAIQIVAEIEEIFSCHIPDMLSMLLNEQFLMNDIFEALLNIGNEFKHEIPSIDFRWSVDLKKCIDATPTVSILKDNIAIVSVGSHSKRLCNVLISNGEILSQAEFPDRIESQVTQICDTYGVVGCYDGYLYCFEFKTCSIKWRFNSGGMIKCRPLVIASTVTVGNYNKHNNVWCVNVNTGEYIWCGSIGTKSIYANPVKLDDDRCLVCSLDGTVAAISVTSKKILWTFNTNAPIFSTPIILNDKRILTATVTGIIFILNEWGVLITNYHIGGNIFSSFKVKENKKNTRILVGSQNHNLYCLNLNNDKFSEIWTQRSKAAIRATPLQINVEKKQYIVNISTNGILDVRDYSSGKLLYQWDTDGDVFSSPVVYKDNLLIGSRNDFLLCIELRRIVKKKSNFNQSASTSSQAK